MEKLGPVAYRLDLPEGSRIHNVFHVSLLRKHLGSTVPTSSQLPMTDTDPPPLLSQPEAILDSRLVQKGKYRPRTEILVKWQGRPVEDATWENAGRLRRSYRSFRLEDKAIEEGENCYVCLHDLAWFSGVE